MRRGKPGRMIVFDTVPCECEPGTALEPDSTLGTTVQDIVRIAADAQSLEDGLRRTIDYICAYIGWPVGHVYRSTETDTELLLPTPIWRLDHPQRFRLFCQLTETTAFRPGIGMIGRVMVERQPTWCADVTADPQFIRKRERIDIGVRACVAFPVLAGDEVAAVCEFFTIQVLQADPQLIALLDCAGMILGQMAVRMHWKAKCEQILAATTTLEQAMTTNEQAAMSRLASTLDHEINSSLFAARTSLDLHQAEASANGEPSYLIEVAQAELERITEVMKLVQRLAQLDQSGQPLRPLKELIEAV
ncbi:MAG: GAF domain-containing protein [Chloroflexales bacterium]|nr:GAF domain-containing protein [Chloroflexales bacterium]